jgi:hypothetical protein
VSDFSIVTRRLATGAAINDESDVQQLVEAGVRYVIDCRGEFDDALLLATHPKISYLWNGTDDDGQPKAVEWFAKSFDFADMVLKHRSGILYAHCAAGINRGPSTLYGIMRWHSRMSAARAEAAIRKSRPQVGIAYAHDADLAVEALRRK